MKLFLMKSSFVLSLVAVLQVLYLRNCCLVQGHRDLLFLYLIRILEFYHLYLGLINLGLIFI